MSDFIYVPITAGQRVLWMINGSYKTERVPKQAAMRSMQGLEIVPLGWVYRKHPASRG